MTKVESEQSITESGIPTTEARSRIAGVAARLFAAQGYDATSVQEIVSAAGVTKPTLYYHFINKEGLGRALVTDPMGRLIDELTRIADEVADPLEAVERSIETHFHYCREDPDRARFMYALFFGPLASGLSIDLAGLCHRIDQQMLRSIGRLADEGQIAADRIEAFFSALRGVIVVSTVDYLYQAKDFGPDLAERIVRDLLHGFGTHIGCSCSERGRDV